jgi:hypothetical protein
MKGGIRTRFSQERSIRVSSPPAFIQPHFAAKASRGTGKTGWHSHRFADEVSGLFTTWNWKPHECGKQNSIVAAL